MFETRYDLGLKLAIQGLYFQVWDITPNPLPVSTEQCQNSAGKRQLSG